MTEGKDFVAYYRVSTKRQGRSGLGLEAQKTAVKALLKARGGRLVDELTEVESGKRADNRPKLREALRACKTKQATLIVAKLDRLARNVAFISKIMESGADFVAADLPEANKLTLHVMAAMAEYERDMISARTKAALKAAKAKGTKLGNPKIREVGKAGRDLQAERAIQFADNVLPIIREIQGAGVSTLQGIADALNARGIPTARGGKFYPTTVKNIMDRTSG